MSSSIIARRAAVVPRAIVAVHAQPAPMPSRSFSTTYAVQKTAAESVKAGLKKVDRVVSDKIVVGIDAAVSAKDKIKHESERLSGKAEGEVEELKGKAKKMGSEFEGESEELKGKAKKFGSQFEGEGEELKGKAKRFGSEVEGELKGKASEAEGKIKSAAEKAKEKL